MIQTLESRYFLSVVAFKVDSHHKLIVSCTNRSEKIVVQALQKPACSPAQAVVVVKVDSQKARTFTGIKAFKLLAAGGNDKVTLSGTWKISCELNGGKGNDTILGSNGVDTINGGPGRNDIYGRGGGDTFIVFPTNGLAIKLTESNYGGTDYIIGGSGNDKVVRYWSSRLIAPPHYDYSIQGVEGTQNDYDVAVH